MSRTLHKETQDSIQDEDEIIKSNGYDDSQQIVESTILGESAVSIKPAISSEPMGLSKSIIQSDQPGPSKSVLPSEPAIASTSTSTASHSASYQSLLLQKKSLKFEIDNIGKVISCCATAVRRWLSVIDDKPFPEKEFLQEYMEGTDKLHELQCKEMELEDKQEKILELEKLRKLKKMSKETKKVSTILLVHLPNNQHTTIKIAKGLTLRQAMAKPMQRRQLILEDCAAYIRHRIMYFISWDTDISTLQCKEVFVETLEQIPVPVFFAHNFVGNTFLLGFCYSCAKSVLYGLYCTECNRKFHTKCVVYAPALCEHIKRRRAYYERLLANNPTTGIVQIRARPVPVPSVSRKRQNPDIFVPKVDKTTQVRAKWRYERIYGKYNEQRRLKRKARKNKKKSNTEDDADDNADAESNDSDSIFSGDSIRIWKVTHDEVIYEDELGSGTYGTVFKAEWQGSSVAIKKLKITDPTPEEIESFKNEVNVLRKLRHDHVLGFSGCICKPYLAIITHFCNGRSLYQRLHVDEDPIELFSIVVICRQTSEAMDYLHSQNIIHRDLKSRNILFHDGLNVKIGDFGLAVMRNQQRKQQPEINDENDVMKSKEEKSMKDHEHQLAGSVRWMAPEVLRMKIGENPYSFQSDVYSFGIVMYELFARDIPYGLKTDALFILFNVGRGCLSPNLNKLRLDTPKKLKKLLIQCIAFEKEKRPLFPYILRRTYTAFKTAPKIRRTTSLPENPDGLPDTYIEKADDAQVFLTSDIDSDSDSDTDVEIDANVNANANVNCISISSSGSVEDVFADF
ncbi:hypothetical protein PUN28_015328 [Cardiocondyla obscurior]|uniref:Uncharacterized protein n=2 Tax=Cardiocondyla obscurior TaxID=286306 RepID=A0AAW2EJW4_9HYME